MFFLCFFGTLPWFRRLLCVSSLVPTCCPPNLATLKAAAANSLCQVSFRWIGRTGACVCLIACLALENSRTLFFHSLAPPHAIAFSSPFPPSCLRLLTLPSSSPSPPSLSPPACSVYALSSHHILLLLLTNSGFVTQSRLKPIWHRQS